VFAPEVDEKRLLDVVRRTPETVLDEGVVVVG
jgi:hypothetical protein